MASRNLDQKILDFDGKEFTPPLALKDMCLTAAVGTLPSDPQLTTEKKVILYRLGQKVHAGGIVDLTAEEIALLKERIAAGYGILAMGRAFELLEKDWTAPIVDLVEKSD